MTTSLLTPAEVGVGFRASAPGAKASPLPCTPNDPPLEIQVPSRDEAKALFVNRPGTLAVRENILAYDGLPTAARALGVAKAGLDCANGTSNGGSIHIAGPADLRRGLTARVIAALAWVLETPKFRGTILVVQAGAKLLTLQFAATSTGAASSVNAKKIVETAVAKVINGG